MTPAHARELWEIFHNKYHRRLGDALEAENTCWILYWEQEESFFWILTTAKLYRSQTISTRHTKLIRKKIQAGDPEYREMHAYITKCRLLGINIRG